LKAIGSFVLLALLVLVAGGSALAQQATPAPKEAMEPPMKQLEAFRRGDFDTAYTFASAEIKEQFDREAFEQMVKGGYPEIARSTSGAVAKSILAPDGTVYVTLKIRGSNGKSIEALYELVLEEGKWKINGVRSRPDPGQV
jgi:ABC-type transporter MlaC component